jgi:TRAP-type C4-dicarboxylate transport system permease small subunit
VSLFNSVKSFFKEKGLSDYVHLLSLPAGVVMLALVVIDVGGREFFNEGLFGAFTVEGLLLAVIVFSSAAASWKHGEFVSMDVFSRRLPDRVRMILYMISILLGLGCCVALIWLSTQSTITAYHDGSRAGPIAMPLWPWRIVVPVGAAILSYEMIAHLIRTIRQFPRKRALK